MNKSLIVENLLQCAQNVVETRAAKDDFPSSKLNLAGAEFDEQIRLFAEQGIGQLVEELHASMENALKDSKFHNKIQVAAVRRLRHWIEEISTKMPIAVPFGCDDHLLPGAVNVEHGKNSVKDISLSETALNCCEQLKITSIEKFVDVTAEQILALKGVGQKTLQEIIWKLEDRGLFLKGENPEEIR